MVGQKGTYIPGCPPEDPTGQEGVLGKLQRAMYGTRDAALNWAREYADTLRRAGSRQGKSNPCLFWNEKLDVAIMVHGDDFVAIGSSANLKTLKSDCKTTAHMSAASCCVNRAVAAADA